MPEVREQEARLWRIVPGFLRKRSKTSPGKDGEEELVLGVQEEPEERAGGRREAKLRSRLSWTYGRREGVVRVPGKVEEVLERTLEEDILRLGDKEQTETVPSSGNVKEVVRSKSVVDRRELERNTSLPGRQERGGLSKEEARRRLMSWRRTTIVRKTSEQQ